jgi:hypothetical protein
MNRTTLRPKAVLRYAGRLVVLTIGFGAFAAIGVVPALAQDRRDGQRDNGRYEQRDNGRNEYEQRDNGRYEYEQRSSPKHVVVRRGYRPSYGYGHPAYVYAPPPVIYATPPALEFVFPFNIR